MMKKQYLFSLICMMSFIVSDAQTPEDVKKLGLTGSQLSAIFEKRQILLTNNSSGRKKKIKEGAFAAIKLKGDTARLELILEAFLADTIVVSLLSPHLTGKSITLKFNEFKLIPIKDIESIEYSVRHLQGTYWAGFLITLVGLEAAVLPIIIPLLTGNAEEVYSQPQFPFIVAGGVVLYILGKNLQKKLKPKKYNLDSEWNYVVLRNKIPRQMSEIYRLLHIFGDRQQPVLR